MVCLLFMGSLLTGCGGGGVNPDSVPTPSPIPGNFWTAKADMPTARAYLAAAELNGKVYAIGGMNSSSIPWELLL